MSSNNRKHNKTEAQPQNSCIEPDEIKDLIKDVLNEMIEGDIFIVKGNVVI